MMEWIEVRDKKPRQLQLVLVIEVSSGKVRNGYLVCPDTNLWAVSEDRESGYYLGKSVSHWMPYPDPPKTDPPSFQVFDVDALKALIRETIHEIYETACYDTSLD